MIYNIIFSVIIMNCHYSCATCSANVYMFACLSCPSTRNLVDSTCVCASGYYEAKEAACYPSSQATILTQMVLPVADILYYTNIGLIWLYIIVMFSRVNSPKIRIVVNFAQAIALISNYPIILDQISKQFLWSLSAFNFKFFFTFFSCDSTSITCKLFEYVWQPLLVLPCLLICFLFSFFLLNICYRTSLQDSLSFKSYWLVSWPMITYNFIDLTAVILSYNITKGALLSNWGFIFVGLYLFAIVLVTMNFFKTINSNQQSKVLYRGMYSWAYGYDQNYHMYYIDYLYEEAREKSFQQKQRQLESRMHEQNQNINKMIQREEMEQVEQNGKMDDKRIKMFVPHSNLYILELFLKLMLGCTTVLLYEYKPQLIGYPLILLINIGVCWIGAFFYFDKSTLLLYWLLSLFYLFCVTFYWLSIYQFAAMAVAFLIPTTIFSIFVVLFFYHNRINSKLINKMFINKQGEVRGQRLELSEQQLKLKKQQESQTNLNNAQNKNQQNTNEQGKIMRREPFVGNITRKVISKNTTKNVISISSQKEDLLRTKTIKSKSIFKNTSNQLSQAPDHQQNVIRHSQYQKKISNFKQKKTAKNKNSRPMDNLIQINEEEADIENESKIDNKQDKTEENMSRQNSREQLVENKPSQNSVQVSKIENDNQSNLQNLLNQPSEVPDSKSFSKRTKKNTKQQA